MTDAPRHTRDLLTRTHAGESRAFDELLEQNLPWLRKFASQRLGDRLRRRAETGDILQDAVMRVLRYGPRFVVSNEAQFRALLGRIVENVIRDQSDWFSAQRRDLGREAGIPRDSVLDLDPAGPQIDRPSQIAQKSEAEAWTRLALSLLEPESRKLIEWREWHGRSFQDIARELDCNEDAARMRFNRAVARLGQTVLQLRSGQIEEATAPDH